jgi:hypothetical protein
LFFLMQEVLGYSPPWQLMSNHKEIYYKDFSSSCATGMSNPITHITRVLLATERTRRRRRRRQNQNLVPYKIYSLCHS